VWAGQGAKGQEGEGVRISKKKVRGGNLIQNKDHATGVDARGEKKARSKKDSRVQGAG